MAEDEFEKLCRDLLEREPNIATCNRYGTRGHDQFGIDLIASARNSPDRHVAQCKCYKAFSASQIKKASDEFLDYLPWWRERQVTRFVLIVAEQLEKPGQREQILKEELRFKTHGIRYEVWSLDTLVTRLRPWPDLVERHIDQRRGGHWVRHICGDPDYRSDLRRTAKRKSTASGVSLEPQFTELMALAAEGLTAKLDACRADARRGLIAAAETALAAMLSSREILGIMSPAVHAKGLRLRASLALDRPQGEARAKVLIAEADRLDRTPSTRLNAQIVLNEQGPEACLEYLQANGDAGEEDINLRAICLLRSARAPEAVDLLAPLAATSGSADSERLLALALSASGRPEDACRHARAAHAREPEGWATRIALGVVLYAAALSRVAAIGAVAGWPEPCDWHVVRRDDASVVRLREAADLFQALIADRQERIDRQTLQAWRLACLANDAGRQAEAEDFCRDILRESPTNAAAIAWALARAFPIEGRHQVFDPASVERALDDLLAAGRGDLLHAMVLASLMGMRGKASKIAGMLRRHQRHFAAGPNAGGFSMLLAEAKLRADGTIPAPGIVDPDRLAMLRLHDESDTEATRDRLVAIAARLRDAGDSGRVFAEAVFRLGALGCFEAVAPFADLLVEAVGTMEAVRLAANAKASVGDHEGAVALLDGESAAFPGGVLPRGFRRLRAECNVALGRLPEAIAEMQALRGSAESAPEVMSLADMYVRRGDLALAAEAVAAIADDPGVPPGQALRFAYILGKDDRALATKLWRRAIAGDIEPDLLPAALSVAQSLALGSEAAVVIERMTAQAAPAGIDAQRAHFVTMSIDQVFEFLGNRREEMEHLARLHEGGTVPLHLVARRMGWSLARLFHGEAAGQERTAPASGMLLAAHGGRTVADRFPDNPGAWRMHVDITAILMAYRSGILDAVERCFGPLKISSHLIPSLVGMRAELTDRIPGNGDTAREIVGAVATGGILLVERDASAPATQSPAAMLELAGAVGGMALLRDEEARSGNAAGSAAINLSGIVLALERLGEIDATEAARARSDLGAEGNAPPIGGILQKGAVLFCSAETIHEAARARFLAPVCSAFEVHVEADFITHLRAALLDGDTRRDTAAWMEGLLARLNKGVQDRTYELLPVAHTPESDGSDPDGPAACLPDLLRVPAVDGNVFWIDDRALNAFAACGTAPLLGIADILAALEHFDRLTAEDHRRILLRLRAGRVAFIQASQGELEFWLGQARVDRGRVVETEELATLRRYVAGCLAQEAILQIPPVPEGAPNPFGEVGFITGWQKAVVTAMMALWTDPSVPGEKLLACSRWLRDSIAVDRYDRLPAFQANAEGRTAVLVAGLAMLLRVGFLLLPPLCRAKDRCADYMEWLEMEVVGPRLRVDPQIKPLLISALAEALAEEKTVESDGFKRLHRVLTARFLDQLPGTLRSELMRNRSLLADIGLDQDLRVTQFGDHTFAAKPYLEAVIRARETGAAVALSDEAGVAASISTGSLGEEAVVNITVGENRFDVSDPLNCLLAADPDAAALLSLSPGWLDVPVGKRRLLLDRLLAMPDRAERVMSAIDMRADTAAASYHALRASVGRGEGISFADLEPRTAQSVLDHLRLPATGAFPERMEAAARELLADYGIDETFERLANLPVALPGAFTDAFLAHTPEKRAALLGHWRGGGPTPVQLIHLARLAVSLDAMPDQEHPLAAGLVGLAEMHVSSQLTVFVALLKAIAARAADWAGMRDLVPADRIAACWCHTGTLFRIIAPVVEPGDLAAMAERHSGDSMSSVFADESLYDADVVSPHSMSDEALLLSGVAYACAESGFGGIPDVLRTQIARLVVQDVEGVPFPQVSLLEAKWLRPDATESFLSAPIDGLVEAVTGTGIGRWYAAEAQHHALAQCLLAAGGDTAGLQNWVMVLCLAANTAIPTQLEEMLADAIGRSSAMEPDADTGVPYGVLRFACLQAARSSSAVLRSAVTGLFDALAPKLLDLESETAAVERLAWALMRDAVNLSRGPTGDVATEVLVELSRRLVEVRPRVAFAVRAFMGRAVQQVRFEVAEGLWHHLLELRSK